MTINQSKLNRQLSVIEKWEDNKSQGTLIGVTGFG
jgi:hypothetical protein